MLPIEEGMLFLNEVLFSVTGNDLKSKEDLILFANSLAV